MNRRIAIMQPYFFPYLGYFHLIDASDVFVIYDNVKYTKKGWINRNRYLCNGTAKTFSIPLQRDSDSLHIANRTIAQSFDRRKLLAGIASAYRRAPQFNDAMPLFEAAIRFSDENLFRFLYHSIRLVCDHLGLVTKFVISSQVEIDHGLRGQDKVLAICSAMGATRYVNAIGGVSLYDVDAFERHGVELRFVESRLRPYEQRGHAFVPSLSILDLMMFNSKSEVIDQIRNGYRLIEGVVAA